VAHLQPDVRWQFTALAQAQAQFGNPYLGVSMLNVLSPFAQTPQQQHSVRALRLIAYAQLPLKQPAIEIAELWVSEADYHQDTSLPRSILALIALEMKQPEQALEFVIPTVALAGQPEPRWLAQATRIAAAASAQLGDFGHAQLLVGDHARLRHPWAEDASLGTQQDPLSPWRPMVDALLKPALP
jgi:hypothetical protein